MSARIRVCPKCDNTYFQIMTKDYENPLTFIECTNCGECLLMDSNFIKWGQQ